MHFGGARVEGVPGRLFVFLIHIVSGFFGRGEQATPSKILPVPYREQAVA